MMIYSMDVLSLLFRARVAETGCSTSARESTEFQTARDMLSLLTHASSVSSDESYLYSCVFEVSPTVTFRALQVEVVLCVHCSCIAQYRKITWIVIPVIPVPMNC